MPPSSPTKRRWIQIIAFVLLTCNITFFTSNALFFGNICLPVIHCNACPLTWFSCPIYTISEYIQFHSIPWLALSLLAGFGLLAGRFFCGWICPMGLLQDLLFKIPSRKLRLVAFLRCIKYVFLFLSVGAAAYWIGKDTIYFFCNYCPVATMEATIPAMIATRDWTMDGWRILRFAVLVCVLLIVVFNARGFCKIICPVGAIMALANKYSLFAMRIDPAKCVHCGLCDQICPMNVSVERCSRTGKAVNRHTECIECLECRRICPTRAIRLGL